MFGSFTVIPIMKSYQKGSAQEMVVGPSLLALLYLCSGIKHSLGTAASSHMHARLGLGERE